MKDPEKEAIVFSVRLIFRKKCLYTANCASREIHVRKVPHFPTNSSEVSCEVHMKFMWSEIDVNFCIRNNFLKVSISIFPIHQLLIALTVAIEIEVHLSFKHSDIKLNN